MSLLAGRSAAWVPLALLLGACSVAADDEATPIDVEAVPFDLLDPAAPDVAPVVDGRTASVCLLDADRLVVVDRQVERDAELLEVVVSLAQVSEEEQATGLETAVGGGEDIDAVEVTGGIASVDFGATADQTLTPDPLATIAQIVCTITAQPGVGAVRFTVDGDPIDVPRDDGSLTDAPVSRDDYAEMLGQV